VIVLDTSGLLAELDDLLLERVGVEAERALLDEVARGAYDLVGFGAAEVAEDDPGPDPGRTALPAGAPALGQGVYPAPGGPVVTGIEREATA
jgi:hypothetical protein